MHADLPGCLKTANPVMKVSFIKRLKLHKIQFILNFFTMLNKIFTGLLAFKSFIGLILFTTATIKTGLFSAKVITRKEEKMFLRPILNNKKNAEFRITYS